MPNSKSKGRNRPTHGPAYVVALAGLIAACSSGSGGGPTGPTTPPTTPSAPAVTSAPAALVATGGDGQTVSVATEAPERPSVRVLDAAGSPVSGVTVTFRTVSGAGSVTGSSVMTDAGGRARVGSWTMGTATGANRLRAFVPGIPSVTFEAMAVAGPAASVASEEGNGQSAVANTRVAVAPGVRVVDAYGNPVAGTDVTFTVTSGGGQAGATFQVTDANGVASVGTWTMGASPGANELRAIAAGAGIAGNPVIFTATGTAAAAPGGLFDIQVRFNPGSTPTATQQAAFDAAQARWESIITGDLPSTSVSHPAGTCTSATPVNETVDDLVIFVTLETIDGPGGVLGVAGPCLVRNGSLLPLAGSMRLDVADLSNLEASGLLEDVILHEMGHILGIGTLWGPLDLLVDPVSAGGTDPHFVGTEALAAFNAVGGSGYAGLEVPVEAGGGPGTEDGHWRETVFDAELMTGWIDTGANPVSLVTVASLADLGYGVDPGGAQAFNVTASPSLVPRSGASTPRFKLVGDVDRTPIEVLSAEGRTVGLIRR